jgi:hypothetical protein
MEDAQPSAARYGNRWGAMISELRFRHAEHSRLRLYVITHDEVDPGDADLLEMAEWAVEKLDWSETLVDLTLTNEWTITVGEHRTTHEIDVRLHVVSVRERGFLL